MIEYFQRILKKYQMFLKYLIVAGLSFGIDIIFFTLFNTFFKISIHHLLIICLTKTKYLKVKLILIKLFLNIIY